MTDLDTLVQEAQGALEKTALTRIEVFDATDGADDGEVVISCLYCGVSGDHMDDCPLVVVIRAIDTLAQRVREAEAMVKEANKMRGEAEAQLNWVRGASTTIRNDRNVLKAKLARYREALEEMPCEESDRYSNYCFKQPNWPKDYWCHRCLALSDEEAHKAKTTP